MMSAIEASSSLYTPDSTVAIPELVAAWSAAPSFEAGTRLCLREVVGATL